MAWTLCTEQDARDIQTLPEIIPDSWSDFVEGMIREHIGQTQLGLPTTSFTEYISGDNTTLIRLKNAPIIAVSSLTVTGVAVASADMYVGSYYVQLLEGSFTLGTRNVIISYTAGGGTVSADVQLSAAMMIVAMSNYYGRYGADTSIKWATSDGQRAGEETGNEKLGLSGHLRAIMRSTILDRKIKIA